MKREFPDNFMFGTATAATQIEGGDKNSNWYYWSKEGKIKDGASSITAADHYNRVEEDIKLMKEMNQQAYRMSIEWSRIYPKQGVLSNEGVKHYIDELSELRKEGITPLVTLHHFSCPQWIQEKGGWVNEETIEYFIQFTQKVVTMLGDLCCEYCTINEPNVFTNDSYMDGKYPPGDKGNIKAYFTAGKNLIKAHLRAYRLIHELREEEGFKGKTRVGFAHHVALLETESINPITRLSRRFMDYSFHDLFFKGMVEGKLCFPIGSGYPQGKGCFCDFIGINYYSRHLVKSSCKVSELFGKITVDESKPKDKYNDLGWEIYSEGLSRVIENTYTKYKLPVYITENGIPDEKDELRGKFIEEHLYQVLNLIAKGIPVEKYFYWSLLDNLEWNDGYEPRFGLIEVDYKTYKRTIRKSGRYYGEIAKQRRLIEYK